MSETFCVDYETFYSTKGKVSVANLGVPNYVKSSYPYMVAVSNDTFRWVGSIDEAKNYFNDAFWEENDFVAANANFDEAWTRNIWPGATRMKPWQCVIDKGAFSQMPGNVAALAKTVLGVKIDKSVRDFMDGKHFRDLGRGDSKRVYDYCLSDAEEEWEIWKKLPEMSSLEQKVAAHTRLVNQRGVHVNNELLNSDKALLQEARHEAFLRIPWAPIGDAPLSHPNLSKWASMNGLPVPETLAKTDLGCQRLMRENPKLAAVIEDMRIYRRANTLITKITALQDRLTDGDILPLELIYCGARHTRRWSSRGFNIQNLDRSPYDLRNGKNVWSRRWITPRPGKVFLILDYAQIEPRCLNWAVGNKPLLDLIKKGMSIYEAYVRSNDIWTSSKPFNKVTAPEQYASTKAEVLGLGYGMGAQRFADENGIEFDDAQRRVSAWRKKNTLITGLWKAFDDDLQEGYVDDGREWQMDMPTGEKLTLFDLRVVRGGYGCYTIKGDFGQQSRQDRLWGGTMTENVIQRMARDIIAPKVVELEEAGLPLVFSAHDEVVLEVDESNKEEAREEAVRILTNAPEWANGLPLAVEGEFAYEYTK